MFNETSTNESPIPSPSKNLKEIQIKEQKNIFQNFSSFINNEKIFLSKEKKQEKISKKSTTNPIKRITKKIIKKKIHHKKNTLLDFDYILKQLFNNKNSKINLYTIEKKSEFLDYQKKDYKNIYSLQENNKDNNNVYINIKEKNLKKKFCSAKFEELSDDFYLEDDNDNMEVSYKI